MRIAMITGSNYPPNEGIGTYSLNLAQQLARRGHRVSIITRGSVGAQPATTYHGVELVHIVALPVYPFHVHLHGLLIERYMAKRRDRFDLIHVHSPLAPALRIATPIVTTLHTSLTQHHPKVEDPLSLLIYLQLPISKRVERRLLTRSKAIAVVNPLLVPTITRTVENGVPVRALGNGVDTDHYAPDPSAREKDLVVAAGRLRHGKGFEDLLLAWPEILRQHATAKLEIVGDGPLDGRLRQLAGQLRIAQSVKFAGGVSPTESDELLRTYQRAAIVVQPSHHEGLSTVVLEAMAVGVPVIATDVGGHPQLLEHNVDGVLVEPGNLHALAKSVTEVLGRPDWADTVGKRGRRKVVDQYSWPRITDAYEVWYAEAMGK